MSKVHPTLPEMCSSSLSNTRQGLAKSACEAVLAFVEQWAERRCVLHQQEQSCLVLLRFLMCARIPHSALWRGHELCAARSTSSAELLSYTVEMVITLQTARRSRTLRTTALVHGSCSDSRCLCIHDMLRAHHAWPIPIVMKLRPEEPWKRSCALRQRDMRRPARSRCVARAPFRGSWTDCPAACLDLKKPQSTLMSAVHHLACLMNGSECLGIRTTSPVKHAI